MSVSELPRRPAGAAESTRTAPVIVMAYSGSGAERLRLLLSTHPELTCTTGTGILPLCHQAAIAWQTVDDRMDGGVSRLGLASTRTLSAGLMTAILAGRSGHRWCEVSTAPTAATETFLRLYPQTRFLIVHCRAETAIRAIIGASPWGLAGPEFEPFVAAYPASSVAALASYWASHTTRQLEFEQAHHPSCLRVSAEDLIANTAQVLQGIDDFLSLNGRDDPPWLTRAESGPGSASSSSASADSASAELPLTQIPEPLLARLNELHLRLGYPPVAAAEA